MGCRHHRRSDAYAAGHPSFAYPDHCLRLYRTEAFARRRLSCRLTAFGFDLRPKTFRVGVELTLSELASAGLTTRLLTLSGGNIEILIGITAPVVAWVVTRGVGGRRIARVWNVVGLLSLLNVAARAALTAPGPLNFIHAEVPNLALGSFPFSFIPEFMAPLAMMFHVLAFRALRAASAADAAPVNTMGLAF
jgi:hypothetical protein